MVRSRGKAGRGPPWRPQSGVYQAGATVVKDGSPATAASFFPAIILPSRGVDVIMGIVMSEAQRTLLVRFSVAAAAVTLATLLRLWLDPILGSQAAFPTYYAAVMFTAWYGGLLPSLAALVAGALLADYLFIEPRGSIFLYDWMPYDVEHQVGMLLYFIVGTFVALLSESLHAGRRRVEAAGNQLLQQQRTERQRVEAELARLQAQLVHQTRLAAIGQVSASIAHDLRNPLSVVRNAVFLLKRRLPKDQPDCARYVQLVEQEIDVTDRIISNLTEMAHGKQPQKQRIDIEAFLSEVFERLEQRNRVHLQMDLEPRPFIVAADPVQLRQVLGNLMANAAQAMPAEGHIRVRARRDGDTDTIVLADDGPGIPPELRENVFEPLFTTKPKGTGLGLTICRQIVQRHGGTIELIETGNQGAAFQVRLPTVGAARPVRRRGEAEPGRDVSFQAVPSLLPAFIRLGLSYSANGGLRTRGGCARPFETERKGTQWSRHSIPTRAILPTSVRRTLRRCALRCARRKVMAGDATAARTIGTSTRPRNSSPSTTRRRRRPRRCSRGSVAMIFPPAESRSFCPTRLHLSTAPWCWAGGPR